jgi:predicted nucleic-acid-binding Zn-ribbon protein
MKKQFTLKEFQLRFQTEEDCYTYLCQEKWGKGYTCRKCKCTEYVQGKKTLWKRCKQCDYDESPTAQTLFHQVKINILDAFYMCYRVIVDKKGVSSMELHRETGIRQKTCWYFKRKIQEAMESSETHLLKGTVEADECMIGSAEENKQGRSSKSKKHKVLVLVEKVKDKKGKTTMGRAYAGKINGYAAKDLLPLMQTHIATNAKVQTDKWTGYAPLKKHFPNLEQEKSYKGKNFPLMHIHIMNLKGWLRGVHHHCSDEHLTAYLNEYHFRFNRRQNRKAIFDSLITNMVAALPLFITLKELCA